MNLRSSYRNRSFPTVRVAIPSDEENSPNRPKSSRRPVRLRRPIVLHGRVQRSAVDIDDESLPNSRFYRHRSYESDQVAVRKEMERRSVYAQLLHETTQYQKTVAELEQVLPEAGDLPEAAWRAKILMKSAQAVDQELWKKLYDYERTLRNREEDPGIRQEQTACMKLHRDFKRAHKSLVMALTVYEKTQRAEIARLGAVGWSERQDEEEDFYTRAMREREAEMDRMNYRMHQVQDMYQDLSFLIQKQQEPIDELEEYTEEAHTYTRDAHAYTRSARRSLWEEMMCFAERDTLCQPEQSISMNDDGRLQVDGEEIIFSVPSCGKIALESIQDSLPEALLPSRKVTASESSIISEYSEESPRGVLDSVSALSDDLRGAEEQFSTTDSRLADEMRSVEDVHSRNLRVSEDFHWLMPFETFAADIQAVQSDIAYFGKEVMVQTRLIRERSD